MTNEQPRRGLNAELGGDHLPGRRGPGRPRGSKNNAAQNATQAGASAASAAARKRRKEERKAVKKLEVPRWKQFEDGTLSVRDLTNRELLDKAISNNDGTWEGKRHPLPPRLVARMDTESMRRARRKMDNLTGPAFRALRIRIDDDDNPAQQLAAVKFVLEHKMGKVPDVVLTGDADSAYDRLSQSAFIIMRGEENVVVEEDIVDAELVEED